MKSFFKRKANKTIAITLSIIMILSMVPVSRIIVQAQDKPVITVSGNAVDTYKLSSPKLGLGGRFIPDGGASIFYGEYAQSSTDFNKKEPIEWYTVVKDRAYYENTGVKKTYPLNTVGAISMVSANVLDRCSYMDFNPKWKVDDKRFNMDYNKSNLFSFLNGTFFNAAFSEGEKATLSNSPVTTFGCRSIYFDYATHSDNCFVYAPDLYMQGMLYVPYAVPSKVGITEYAKAKGVPIYNGYPQYWLRTVPAIPQLLCDYQGISSEGRFIYTEGARRNQYGVRPMTRVNLDSILFASEAGTKDNSHVINDNIDAESKKYKLTVLDKDRNFSVTQNGDTEYAGDTATLDLNYSGAVTGDNEYISYVLTDENNRVIQYQRFMKAESESGNFIFKLPARVLNGDKCKIKFFNEKINLGNYTDYASNFRILM